MPHSGIKISLYADRSVSQCLETTFDFMRSCRSVWFRMTLWLFMPLCFLGVIVWHDSMQDIEGISPNPFGMMDLVHAESTVAVVFLGMLLSLVLVFSLLEAYGEYGADIDGFSMRRMLPYIRRQVMRAFRLTFLFALIFFFFFRGGGFLAGLLWLLLSLLPSVYLIERSGPFVALAKSVRLAFRSFFQLATVIFFIMLFGFLMLVALVMPFELVSTAGDVFSFVPSGNSPLGMFFSSIYYMAFALACCMLLSMLQLALAFQFGSVSERVDDASLESSIQRFENL